jgi:hypothetical protein
MWRDWSRLMDMMLGADLMQPKPGNLKRCPRSGYHSGQQLDRGTAS